jgi:hypothetical protein
VTEEKMPPLPHADLRAEADEVALAAERARPETREYLDDVRGAAARLSAPAARPDDIRAALAVLEQHAQINDVAPVDSSNRGTRAAKTVVRKAVFFTTHHLATQVSSLGWALVWLGNAAADRIERLEQRVDDTEAALREQVARLDARLAQLERNRGSADASSQ